MRVMLIAASLCLIGLTACKSTDSHHSKPLPLQDTIWMAEDIGGQGIVDHSQATLQFMADGRLAGQASCNRYFGGYTRDGFTLSFSHMGMTKMACPPAVMDQEDRFLAILNQVTAYEQTSDGALVLKTGTGQAIRFRAEAK
ncbi:META domain-containing protein [Govanella unica]|uniref:META domain-containing protein n=1 Tax=Govanella unica TaxID=2975056 RepID=A0A9X3TZI0_9PROT|nr:META domain-containing protein [Govania unica]MDA5194317.1 META domain-containing protein [Govania unica]